MEGRGRETHWSRRRRGSGGRAGICPGRGSPGAGGGGRGGALPGREGTAPAGAVELNSAAQQELDLLPGIGPAKAAAILEYREQHGPFLEPDGLLEVPGIGETLFGDIADYICVDAQEEDP